MNVPPCRRPSTQFVGVDRAAATCAQHLLGVVVQRLEPFGGRLSTETARPTWLVVEPRGDGGPHRVGVTMRPCATTSSMPAPTVSGATGPQRGQLLEFGIDHRPDVHPDVVHVQRRAPAAGARRGPAGSPRRSSRWTARPAAGVIWPSSSRTTANSRTCASATRRWSAALSLAAHVVQQDILWGVQPGDVEVAQPPQVQPPPDHRVHARGRGSPRPCPRRRGRRVK